MAQTALITGASSGIGMELARIFAKNGHNVVLVARSEDKLQKLAQELQNSGVQVKVLAADLSRMDAIENVVSILKQENLAIDFLVNNAGFGDFGSFYKSDWPKQAMMIDLNVKSLTYLTRLMLPDMVRRRSGKILNLASTAAFQPGPYMSVYYASKAYVLHFSEAISNELKGSGVTVTALCPGPTKSGFQQAAAMSESRLFNNNKIPSSAEVAQYGYKALMKSKVVAVHGLINKVLITSARLAPRAVVRNVMRKLQGKAD